MPGRPLQRILLIRTDRIGDVILTTPAASLLKQRYPGISITFMVRDYTAPMLAHHPDIDHIMVYRPESEHRGLSGIRKLAAELALSEFDAALLFYPRPALALALKFAGVKRRIGPGYRWYSLLLNERIYEHRKKGKKHELELNLSLLSPIMDATKARASFAFRSGKHLLEWRRERFRERGVSSSYVIIHPGNGGSAPNLEIAQYRHITSTILEHSKMDLVFTGTQAETALINTIATPHDPERVIKAAGEFSIEELMAVIEGASLFISSSTGPMHMAAALGVPVLGFYCPSPPCSPHRWGPYGQLEWAICPVVDPCDHGRPSKCPHGNCIHHLTNEVLTQVVVRRLASILPAGHTANQFSE